MVYISSGPVQVVLAYGAESDRKLGISGEVHMPKSSACQCPHDSYMPTAQAALQT